MIDHPITETTVMAAALALIDETVAYERPLDDEFRNMHYFSLGVVRGIMDMVEKLTGYRGDAFASLELLEDDEDD